MKIAMSLAVVWLLVLASPPAPGQTPAAEGKLLQQIRFDQRLMVIERRVQIAEILRDGSGGQTACRDAFLEKTVGHCRKLPLLSLHGG